MKTYYNGPRQRMMYGGSATMMPKKKMQIGGMANTMGGGMANTMGNSMAIGMKKDKMNKNMAAMGIGMRYGSKVKKK